jgi:spore coat protein H
VTSVSIESSFQKENNPDTDWSDIKVVYDALHANNRAKDATAWRAVLEKVFDVDTFLEWLAISAIIQNWDNYGSMTHNFYLYHDPDTDRLVWISWDHNMVLGVDGGGVGGGGGIGIGMGMGVGMGVQSTSLDKKDVGNDWPLIRFLLDDPVYYQRYLKYIKEIVNGPFTVDKMKAKTEKYTALLKPYFSQTSFNQAVQQLLSTVGERVQAAQNFLITQQL